MRNNMSEAPLEKVTVTVNGKDLLEGLSDEAKDKFLENFINAMDRDHVTELMWDAYYDR